MKKIGSSTHGTCVNEGKHDVLLRVPISLLNKVDTIVQATHPTVYRTRNRSAVMLKLIEHAADEHIATLPKR